ncbi:extracellular solute-binding protein family 5 [Solidesulfovibrio carbinoliphilus subsp. oakridgensis]|uniref:Extracellular solute-binding protein family 5 n=1 Tax=Solidesulfovibrio carbinoliphilus subsp. oakridgensis TaxID=694327 RepID=G7Q4Z6_9BACT|nr:peptide-binding protein [Solidesulfovibrio carbinoliphilus]EHJ47923.1 extracellular solute-binding protein family 5 [Solidesulfovibrio carbinoliphilus subsp. oakridgensis]
MRSVRATIYGLILLVLVLAGCKSEPAPAPKADSGAKAQSAPAPAGEPVPGGRIVMATIGEPSNLIPPLASDSASHEVADLLYVSPLRYDKDIQLECMAAERYEVLDGGKLLKFWLKPGIRWTDGVELTAEDVEFTYKLMVDPKTPTAYAEDYKAVASFTVTGKYSFEVRYAEPFARSLVTWAGSILPKHLLEGQDLMNTKYAREPVGAGPYRLVSWEPGRRLVLDVNTDYFEGRPYIDQVVYRIIPDTATMFLELKAGGIDMMGLTPQQYLYQTKGPAFDADWRKFKYLSFAYTYLGYNLKSPFFADVRVRQALAHAVNKDDIVKGALLGLGLPTIGPYKPGTWMYDTDIKDYAFDPALAKSLLAEAGWQDRNGDGVLEDPSGRPFRFTILTNQGNDQRVKAATIIQSQFAAIGVMVEIRTVEWASFIKEFVDKGNFDALVLGWTISQDPDVYDVWHGSRAVPGGLNFVGYKNPEADALLERGRRTVDQAERKKIYDAFQEILHKDQPYLFLFAPYALPILSSRFQDVAVAPAGITYNFTKWWIPRDKQTFRLAP